MPHLLQTNVGTLPKRSRTVALKENVDLGAEEKCVTTIPGLPYTEEVGLHARTLN